MNVITWDKAYCLYPRDTIGYGRTLFLQENNPAVQNEVEKYRRRGMKDYWIVDSDKFHIRHVRWIEDPRTWVYTLEDLNLGISYPANIDPIRTTTWSISSVPEEHHRIHFHTVQHDGDNTIFPLVIATDFFKTYVKDQRLYMRRLGRIFPNDPPSMIGEDR